MDMLKQFLNDYARPFLVKYVTRGLTYGATAISAKLAIFAPDEDTVTKVAGWVTAGALAGVAMLIDWIHHRKDRGEAAKPTS